MTINPVVTGARRYIRLPEGAYRVPGSAWFVTVGTNQRARAFAHPGFAQEFSTLLIERCARMDAGLDLYCLMPDHVHLLIQIRTTGLVDVLRDVKSRSTRLWWKHGGSGPLWQRSFHDRGLRNARDYDDAIRYLLHNPVEAGLVEDWADYPWIGGALIQGNGPSSPSSS